MRQPRQTTLRKQYPCIFAYFLLGRQENYFCCNKYELFCTWQELFCTWYEELGLVKDRQLLFPTEPLNDARHLKSFQFFKPIFGVLSHLIWVLQSDLLHILHPQS